MSCLHADSSLKIAKVDIVADVRLGMPNVINHPTSYSFFREFAAPIFFCLKKMNNTVQLALGGSINLQAMLHADSSAENRKLMLVV
ncbi:hypothetical protein AVEN_171201-1 [Araneus ventricosus]|uniref:Uncharacterized protein n=1 Tax=Araneus ventricosus TaxID=182803 RepID=A0A4Y2V3J2_ARAVE|nr:hypothetical protein AVEN_171201-1 [Araneus ventricosus]